MLCAVRNKNDVKYEQYYTHATVCCVPEEFRTSWQKVRCVWLKNE